MVAMVVQEVEVKDQIELKRMEGVVIMPITNIAMLLVVEQKVVKEAKVDMVVTMEGLAIGEVEIQVPQYQVIVIPMFLQEEQ
tara:strand:+ start:115 stop:360 length:246 start_codon:yes stop_codon:yes gene_type:complete